MGLGGLRCSEIGRCHLLEDMIFSMSPGELNIEKGERCVHRGSVCCREISHSGKSPNPSLSDFFSASHDHTRTTLLPLRRVISQPRIPVPDTFSLTIPRLAHAIRLFSLYGRCCCVRLLDILRTGSTAISTRTSTVAPLIYTGHDKA